MAMNGSSANHHSAKPGDSVKEFASNNGSSPNHSPYPGVSPPWSQIVAVAAAAAAPPPSPPLHTPTEEVCVDNSEDHGSDAEDSSNGDSVKECAWNKKFSADDSSRVLEHPFMGADSWPALSKPVKGRTSSQSHSISISEPAKVSMDASSVHQSQGTGNVVSTPQRQVVDNASTNTKVSNFDKTKLNNTNPSSNGGHSPQLSSSQGPITAVGSHPHNSSTKGYQSRPGFGSNDQRNSFRNRNGGPHHGAHHHNYGNRRDHDRANQGWNTHQTFNGRDNYMSPRFSPRFIRPQTPHNPVQFYGQQQPMMRPYGGIGFSELSQVLYVPPPPMDSIRGVPFVPPIPPNPMFFQPPNPQLHTKIVNQIDYYFSNENLIKDVYLRNKMDDQGWVPISLIAGFRKVMELTNNVQIILDAVRTSSVVEVQVDKIRRRNDWMRWIIPPVQLPNLTGSQTVGKLAEQVQSISLGESNNGGARELNASQNRSFGGDLNSQLLQPTSTEGSGQAGINHSISARK